MPDIWMDVDTALAEVPVNIMPLIDDTDFKSRETAVAYNATGMDLVWNFVTCAGAFTQTAVTPTTGGNYDWTHQGDGMYTIEIPASGGASINNDTEGFGWFTGVCTGVLPWRGPVIGFRAAGLNDKMVESAYDTTRGLAGTALPAAAAEASGGLYTRGTGAGQINQDANGRVDTNVAAISADTTAADNCEAMFDGTGYAGGTARLKVDVDTIKTQAVTCAGGVTVPAATLASTTNITAASGVTLTATTGLGNQTANITGNLSGSVGSVTGAVGSVTGNVGGNVAGSVGSVATGGITAASIADGAIDNAAFAADVGSTSIGTNVIGIAAKKGVVDALNVDTYAEPGQGDPPATATLVQKIGYLFKNWRNKKTQTSSEWALYADDGSTKDQEAAVSDDGTTTTKGEIGTGA